MSCCRHAPHTSPTNDQSFTGGFERRVLSGIEPHRRSSNRFEIGSSRHRGNSDLGTVRGGYTVTKHCGVWSHNFLATEINVSAIFQSCTR